MATPNGVPPTSESNRIQIIDENKTFTHDLNGAIKEWGLLDSGFNYDLVAIFGSQSTGKSTLLNRLFGTTFDVMNETERRQTTKGIWMCGAKNMPLMVMDVEGTDGRERGEDQDFERKSALFSLASTEVLLVNMWEHQVGLYHGANMALLKTVFEVNLQLFGKRDATSPRTLLLFVIRDHVGATPLSNLRATLIADLSKIWDSIAKPEGLDHAKLDDYFDMSFVALAHKILRPDQFEEDVLKLRERFFDRSREDYVFKPVYHKRIPADGVAHYMEGIWEQVQSNKDLDLPTQQELLAQFRCDEIAAGALEEFNIQARSFRKPVEGGRIVEELGRTMSTWKQSALTRFDTAASRYHKGVYTRKRADLLAQLNTTLSPLFLGQLKNLHRSALTTFKKDLVDGVRTGGDYDFGTIVQDAGKKAEEFFESGAREAAGLAPLGIKEEEGEEKQPIDAEWSYTDEFEQLKHEMQLVADQCRKDETKKMVNSIEKTFIRQIAEPVEVALSKAKSDMWDTVLKAFRENLEQCEATYLSKAKSFNCNDEENGVSLYIIKKRAWVALRKRIDELTADPVILTKLRDYFEERFRYDEKGVPRVWKPEDDMDGSFQRARDKTLELVHLYAKIAPKDSSLEFSLPPPPTSLPEDDTEYDVAGSMVVLSETKQMDVNARFRRDADAYYLEAKRSIVSSVSQVPGWAWGLMLILGWNEIMTLIFNPLYAVALCFACGVAYTVIQLGLAGPIMQVSKTVAGEVQRQATAKLREQFAEPVPAPPVARQNSTASVYSSEPGLTRRSTTATVNGYSDADEMEMKPW
ncbi:hypothetical protein M407DRAFT_169746 [Tulasnella calospora MUT 4182]|uniref:GB1/RHD3-type G domain-containing protein n=1 Tax=Tulasnella calospora MUT 4182 TaxID=1051891 RepID=A0A0C3QE75_9AGAM|nr:hypothetical protein M407DRAFT_169746 [Tulasnella calospora MUT 4182]